MVYNNNCKWNLEVQIVFEFVVVEGESETEEIDRYICRLSPLTLALTF
jgi:hypothetical protein